VHTQDTTRYTAYCVEQIQTVRRSSDDAGTTPHNSPPTSYRTPKRQIEAKRSVPRPQPTPTHTYRTGCRADVKADPVTRQEPSRNGTSPLNSRQKQLQQPDPFQRTAATCRNDMQERHSAGTAGTAFSRNDTIVIHQTAAGCSYKRGDSHSVEHIRGHEPTVSNYDANATRGQTTQTSIGHCISHVKSHHA